MSAPKQVLWRTLLKIVIASTSIILALLLPFSAPTHALAQAPEPPPFDPARLVFETVAGDYGNIYNVIQDQDGFLWLAGINGAIKYNGYEAETIYSGETVSALFEDSEGLISMVVRWGVVVYDKKTGKITQYVPNPNDPNALSGETLVLFQKTQLLAEDRDGFIWIATLNGLNKFDKKNWKFTVTNYVYNAEKAGKGGLGGKIVHTIIQDKSGIFWLVVNEHGFLQKIDPGARQFQSILLSQNPEEGFVDVSCPLRLGPDGNIWVTEVTTGIARVDPKTGRIINHFLHDPLKPEGFPVHIEDFDFEPRQKDIVWVVAKGVVVKYNWNTQTVVNRYPSGTRSKIWPVWTDKQNPDLLYGTVWAEGLLKFNKQTGQVTIFTPDPAHPEKTLTGSAPYPVLPSYYQMDGNQMWLINSGIGFDLFDFNTEKVVRKHLFNQTDFTSQEFEAHAGYIDSKGRFWMGHNQYDQASGKFTPFKSLYGYSYPSTSACLLAEDKQGLLWNAGFLDGTVTRINPETGETEVFTEQDGISPAMAYGESPVTLPDGQIWMAGTGGIIFFNPDQIVDNPYQAPVHITQLTQGENPCRF